jgi:hypothetical protein
VPRSFGLIGQLMLQARRTGSMSFNRSMVLYVETLPPLEHDPERVSYDTPARRLVLS